MITIMWIWILGGIACVCKLCHDYGQYEPDPLVYVATFLLWPIQMVFWVLDIINWFLKIYYKWANK